MRVLVTGATGYVGSRLIPELPRLMHAALQPRPLHSQRVLEALQ